MSSLPAWIIYGRIWSCLSYILPPDLVSAYSRDGDRCVKRGYCDWWPYQNSRHWERSSFQSDWEEGRGEGMLWDTRRCLLHWLELCLATVFLQMAYGLRSPIKRPEKLRSRSCHICICFYLHFGVKCVCLMSYFSQCYIGTWIWNWIIWTNLAP